MADGRMDVQMWLDQWADTVLADDYARFRAMTALPFTMTTTRDSWVVRDEAELHRGFTGYRDTVRGCGATMIVRALRGVTELANGDKRVRYERNILRGANRVMDPLIYAVDLRRCDGDWVSVVLIQSPPEAEPETRLPRMRFYQL